LSGGQLEPSDCITDNTNFRTVCLNPVVLETSYISFLRYKRHISAITKTLISVLYLEMFPNKQHALNKRKVNVHCLMVNWNPVTTLPITPTLEQFVSTLLCLKQAILT
jgi:hypothetical protein